MKSGQLKITPGLTMQIYYGPKTVYNSETSKVMGAQLRYVIYALGYLRIYWFTRNPDGFKSSLDYGTWNT
jgi:hypothetical protein